LPATFYHSTLILTEEMLHASIIFAYHVFIFLVFHFFLIVFCNKAQPTKKKLFLSCSSLRTNHNQQHIHRLLLIFLSADGSRWRVGGDAAALLGFALAEFVFFISVLQSLDLCFFVFRFHYCGGSSFSSLSSIV
jgi:hypothetical protein